MKYKRKSKNTNNFSVVVFIFIFLFLVLLGYTFKDIFFQSSNQIEKQNSNHLMSSVNVIRTIDTIDFMGETIDIDDYPFLRERIEREFFIVTDNIQQYKLWVKRTGKYFPYYQKIIDDMGLPDDLKFLSVAESFLRNAAYSNAGASGLWQFMPATAREQNLIVNDYVDERNNYRLATRAALEYLNTLYNRFDNWNLALAAYNKGDSGLARTIDRQGFNDYFELLLNTETRRFVPRIMAIKIAYEHRNELGLRLEEQDYYTFPDYELIQVENIDDLYEFARSHDMSIYTFIQLNPWIDILQNTLPARDDGDLREIKILS